ncbi:SDR family oxidoreductase [soil metagenome]|jgi:uncharacterized protein YbjT (DUF2867 family)
MILVTGATGTVGSALLPILAEHGASVRALAHSQAGRAAIEAHGAEAVDGDFDRPETLERAMAGCDRVFLLSPASPAQAGRERRAIDIAGQAGVAHVVALSVMGASHDSPMGFARWHAEIDDHLAAAGVGHTILRPAGFMQSHLLPVDTVRAEGAWYGMTGDGASGFIDAADIAAVAAHVLTTDGHEGATYEVTGPESISMPQAAAQLSEVIGGDVRYVDVPADGFRANLAGAGLPDWLADSLVALYGAIRAGHAATVTNEVEKATGRPARPYRQFAENHRDAFAAA